MGNSPAQGHDGTGANAQEGADHSKLSDSSPARGVTGDIPAIMLSALAVVLHFVVGVAYISSTSIVHPDLCPSRRFFDWPVVSSEASHSHTACTVRQMSCTITPASSGPHRTSAQQQSAQAFAMPSSSLTIVLCCR